MDLMLTGVVHAGVCSAIGYGLGWLPRLGEWVFSSRRWQMMSWKMRIGFWGGIWSIALLGNLAALLVLEDAQSKSTWRTWMDLAVVVPALVIGYADRTGRKQNGQA